MLNSVFGAVARLALWVLPVCRLVGRGKTKCANAGGQNFKIFCAVGKKIKHRRVRNECRLTRCPNVVSSECMCSLVKMVYFFSVYRRLFVDVVSFFTLAGNLFIPATNLSLVRIKVVDWRSFSGFFVYQTYHNF